MASQSYPLTAGLVLLHAGSSFIAAKRIALTHREGQLVSLLSQGLKNKEIASMLLISEGTVKVYLSRLFQKVGVKDRFELALYGLKNLTTGHGAGLGRTAFYPGDFADAGPAGALFRKERTANIGDSLTGPVQKTSGLIPGWTARLLTGAMRTPVGDSKQGFSGER